MQPIEFVRAPGVTGAIGMMSYPGRRQPAAASAEPLADFAADLERVRDFAPAMVVALLGTDEFVRPAFPEFMRLVREAGFRWEYAPVGNYGVPDAEFLTNFLRFGREAREIVRTGGRVLLHCRYGQGRTGLVAAMILIELGMDPAAAIRAVRLARPRTIENETQERWVSDYRPTLLA